MKKNYYLNIMGTVMLGMIIVSCQTKSKGQQVADSLFRDPKKTKAVLTFDKTKVDFGNVSEDTLLTGKFTIRNSGTEMLIINNVQPDCSCTSYHLTKRKILPNDTASLSLSVMTKHKSGKIMLYSTVSANTENRLYSLRILANVN
ncbi:DUF1573 domain-containing protein [Mucilaginibacter aquaedulcis]|uniref:DUF1573 domain-containing protein n=1 Tax=Mucilaginibacter aquaedulcis TaxID=1187081 RepID=UPI0025B4F152|nr:DUF1573 domain-containing protein [Mucilaginibacter aquaedulcis]MDN3548806.1 DUF1573 domain-containing protein [Mucilaginibacter aquaedulcis]